jgi:hypothetical protein
VIIPCRVNLRYTPPTSQTEEEMILDPGAYHLDGTTALRYVRTRRGDSDFERESRQQQFLKGVWHQFRKASIIPKIPGLWSAMKGALATNLSLGDVLALAPVVLDLQPQHIRSRYIGRGQVESWTTPEGAEVLLPIPDKIQQVVAGLYAPSSGNEDQPASEAAHIQIQNGTGRSQLATIAADQLGWYGLDAVATGAADRTDYQNTQIVVLNDKPETVKVLVQAFKVKPQNVINGSEPDPAADIRVILGNDYDPCQP